MIVKLLTKTHLEFLSLKGGCRGSSSLHMSTCHIVGNLMLICYCHYSMDLFKIMSKFYCIGPYSLPINLL